MAAKVLDRGRRRGRDARGRPDLGRRQGRRDVRVELRLAAAGRATAGARSASSTAASAAGTSRASRTRSPRATSSCGSAAACSAAAPTTGAASRCASGPGLQGRSRDGLGDDWPIGYDDVKPYYDQLDQLVGIFGSNEGIENEPDGIFLPPPKPRCYELAIQKACEGLGIPCIPSRLSILTRPHDGRAACHYCGQCGRGCSTHSNFSTPSVLLPPALATGRLTLVTGAMAREVTTDAEGLATGVSYVDKATGKDRHVRARVVVLAASACESARLLLNSRSTPPPEGPRQLERRRGPLPHRHRRHQHRRLHPDARGPAAAQRGRRGRHAPLRAVVARQPDARLPARLPHRARRRARHAGLRLRRAASTRCRAAATARRSRTTTAATTAPSSASAGAAR